ncbi:hypothetical protein [Devosia sp. 2618]|uniref:hypothetical protein n=1 Tax=Devosia sp. 2618 TaxID=3156454 RepID=UPI003391667C
MPQSKVRSLLATSLFLAFTPALLANQLDIAGTYGTDAGCAIINGERSIPDGKVRALGADKAINDEATCTFIELSDPTVEDGKTVWEANVVCEAGHEAAENGTLRISLQQDLKSVDIKVLEGAGPKGKLNLCP